MELENLPTNDNPLTFPLQENAQFAIPKELWFQIATLLYSNEIADRRYFFYRKYIALTKRESEEFDTLRTLKLFGMHLF
jgi:hypothetical protein